MRDDRRSLFADAMLLIPVLGWAVSYPFAKAALRPPEPELGWRGYEFLFLAGRFWLVFALFLPFALRRHSWRELVANLKPGFWVGVTLVAALAPIFKAFSIQGVSATRVAFIMAFSALLVPVGLWLFKRQKVFAATWVGLVIATIGLTRMEGSSGGTFDLATLLGIAGAIAGAVDIILIDHFRNQRDDGSAEPATDDSHRRYKILPFLTTQFLVVAVIATVVALTVELPNGLPPYSVHAFVGMPFMALVATALAFWVQAKYQPDTNPARAALLYTMEPVFAAGAEYLHPTLRAQFLTDFLTRWDTMVLGAALIFVGVAWSEYAAARRSMRDAAAGGGDRPTGGGGARPDGTPPASVATREKPVEIPRQPGERPAPIGGATVEPLRNPHGSPGR
jgi:drug/metabolite transporter (DMT)-like permease